MSEVLTVTCVDLFERLSEKMCTRQSRKVIWDMINNLVLTLQLSNQGVGRIERFSLDCRKTKTKVNTLANQRA